MPRTNRLPFVLSALALGASLAGASAAAAGASGPIASAAADCTSRTVPDPGNAHHFVYENIISAKGVACATRNSVEDKFEACRLKHGLKGRCTTKEVGFTCKEVGPRQAGAVAGQFNAKVSCRRGGAQFSYFYEQN